MEIEKITLVDASGRGISAGAGIGERKTIFPPSGIIDVVKLRWELEGAIHEIDLMDADKKSSWEVLPDKSGVVVTNKRENSFASISVINFDGRVRFSLPSPWPSNQFYSPLDSYGFSYPTHENGVSGVVVWVWSPTANGGGVSSEYFYAIDLINGDFLDFHPIR